MNNAPTRCRPPFCRRCYTAGMLLTSIAMLGCGGSKGPARYQVSGSITYRGKPVPAGYIIFEPDRSRGNKGPAGGGKITDGRYATDSGTVGGPLQVRIRALDGIPVDIPGEGIEASGSPLFPEYVTSIELPKADSTYDLAVPD